MRRSLAAAAVVGAVAIASPLADANAPTVWTIASIAPEGSPTASAIADWSRGIERGAAGRLKLRLRVGGVLGEDPDTLLLCKQGKIQGWGGASGSLAEHVPALSVLETPTLFSDVSSVSRALPHDSMLLPPIAAAHRAAGFEPGAVAFVGFRAVSTRDRPVRLPPDLRGVRIRSANVEMHRAMWRLLGADAQPVELNHVAAAFRERRIDATDTPVTYVFATALQDQIRFHTRTQHMVQFGAMTFHQGAFARLPPDIQGKLRQSFPPLVKRLTAAHENLEAELLGALVAGKVVQVIEPGSAERAAWKSALSPLGEEAKRLGGPAGAALLAAMRARLR